jgi:hypothetical protein
MTVEVPHHLLHLRLEVLACHHPFSGGLRSDSLDELGDLGLSGLSHPHARRLRARLHTEHARQARGQEPWFVPAILQGSSFCHVQQGLHVLAPQRFPSARREGEISGHQAAR